MAHAQQA